MWPTLCQTCDGVPSAFPDCTFPGNLFIRPHTALFDTFQLSRAPHAAPTAPVAHTHTATTPQPDVTPSTLAMLDSMRIDPELIQDHPGTMPLMLIHDGGSTVLACRLLGVYAPWLHEGKGIVSIRHVADQYAALTRQVPALDPSHLHLFVGG